ncbi:MAG: squalene/phytoene synthase family protein, partial [Candidatus Krumholzibacteriia bacterium]
LLPGALGDAVLQADLFCRIADTVEDSPHLDPACKPACLEEYSRLFPLRDGWEGRVRAWSHHFGDLEDRGADHELCSRAEAVFRAFQAVPAHLRAPVEDCVREMALGMRDFTARRVASPGGRLQLESIAELEQYCHCVAGTVGQMLCRLFASSSRHFDALRQQRMRELAGRFGLAMQLTNIIKDVAEDARRGACYVPRLLAARHRLDPEEILDPQQRPQARAVLRELAVYAVQALDAALDFTLIIPRREARLRLFCLWPIFLAVRTLRRVLQDERLFVPGARPRITRHEVRHCLGRATLAVLSNRAIARLYAHERLALEAGLVTS